MSLDMVKDGAERKACQCQILKELVTAVGCVDEAQAATVCKSVRNAFIEKRVVEETLGEEVAGALKSLVAIWDERLDPSDDTVMKHLDRVASRSFYFKGYCKSPGGDGAACRDREQTGRGS